MEIQVEGTGGSRLVFLLVGGWLVEGGSGGGQEVEGKGKEKGVGGGQGWWRRM